MNGSNNDIINARISSTGLKGFMSRFGWIFTLIILLSLAIADGFLAAHNQVVIMFALIGGVFCMLIIYQCFFHPARGYYLLLVSAFFAFYPNHLLNKNFPFSTFVEILTLALFLGTYWEGKNDGNHKGNLLKSGVSIMLMINILYFIIEIFNPNMNSMLGWLFFSKRYTAFILFYIISYRLINTPARVRFFLKFWIVMSFIAALYGCFQKWFGYLPMELRYIKSDPHEYKLMFQGGWLRIISFFDGIVTFGILCGYMSIVCIILAINVKKKSYKYRLWFCAFILFLGMSYAGMRTTTIMLPLGFALYILMKLKHKATLLTLFIGIMAALFLVFAPVSNPTINRMRSTFDSKEESLNVRNNNRKFIQPYFYKHPFGGGASASGVNGLRFNPTHELAGFPPDSGLMAMALDFGWIGLALSVIFYLMILYQGIYYYFKIENEEYKLYILAITCAFFAIMCTFFSQDSLGQIPNGLFFYGAPPLFKRLFEFDEKERSLLLNNNR